MSNAAYMREYRRANLLRIRENEARSRAKRRVQERERHFKRKYGLTLAERDAIFASQGFRCAICQTDKPGRAQGWGWHVDHDHATDTVRAILCHHCNIALGAARDNPAILRMMADYIEQHHV